MREGRYFSRDKPDDIHTAVINETAARMMGLKLGTTIYEHSPGTPYKFQVIGIMKDFYSASMRRAIDNVKIKLLQYQPKRVGRYVSVRYKDGRRDEALAHIRQVWGEFMPSRSVEYMTFKEDYGKLAAPEITRAAISAVFGVIGLLFTFASLLAAVGDGRHQIRIAQALAGSPIVVAGIGVGYWAGATWVAEFYYHTGLSIWLALSVFCVLACGVWFIIVRRRTPASDRLIGEAHQAPAMATTASSQH